LVRPLALSQHSQSLVVVPDRWLARLPFAALVDRQSGQYLIEQRAVSVTPSATLLVRSSRPPRAIADHDSLLAVAVSPAGAYEGISLPMLPNAAREARKIASLYQHSELLRDSDATRENFRRAALSSNVIHFVGHAVADLEDPGRSVLLFTDRNANALQPLSLGELLDLGIGNTDLVVLSACRTQDSLADDREGLLGLAGAFIAGGVSEVVASPWDVDDTLAPPLMEAFHHHYSTSRSASAAFRLAVLDQLRSVSPEARSPAAWGGFTVITGSLEKAGV
jgi:CHAT domain-containing protein